MDSIKYLRERFKSEKIQIFSLFLFGFILRLIAARNIGVSADDVNHAVRPINMFNSGKLVIWDQSTSLWYYVQDVFYKFFGNTQIGSRFATAFFGSLLIVLMFIFVKKVFASKNAAFFASLLIAVSPMLIKNTLPEMDTLVAFMTLISFLFFFDFLKNPLKRKIALAALFIGVGIMIKLYVLFFAVSMTLFLIYHQLRLHKKKELFFMLALWGIIITLLVMPTLIYNYLLYKDKGFMDLIFTNTLKLGVDAASKQYSGAGWMAYTDYKGFLLGNQRNFDPTPIPGFVIVLSLLFRGDPLLCIFFILGLIFAFKQQRNYLLLFAIVFLPAFIYLGAQIPMSKHFIWALVIGAPISGLAIEKILIKYPKKSVITIAIIVFSLFYLGIPKGVTHAHFYGQSAFGKLVDIKETFPKNTIVVADSRIYRGNIHWGLAGTNYVEASDFFTIVEKVNAEGNLKNFEVYYVECVIDDCGWGTVAGQTEFNESMEEATRIFAKRAHTVINFTEPDRSVYTLPFTGKEQVIYRLYKLDLSLNPAIVPIIKKTHSWYKYPIGYDRSIHDIFDDYDTISSGDAAMQWFAFRILYIELFVVFATIAVVVYLFWRLV